MFIYNGELFEQIDGVAVESPLGLTLANFLSKVKNKILNNIDRFYPKIYLKNGDDIFAIFDDS